MKLVADEGVDKPIVDSLRAAGFDVVYILETNQGADDASILDLSNEQRRLLLTQDKDFGELVYRMKTASSGVVLIRLTGIPLIEKASIIVNLLLQYREELLYSFSVIQTKAIRIRRFK